MSSEKTVKKNVCRGLACVSPAKRRKISRMGAQALNASGKAHRWTSAEAKKYGKKGGRGNKKKI